MLWFFATHTHLAAKNNLRRLLRMVETLAELGPELTAERDFSEIAQHLLATLMEAAGTQEGVIFGFSDKPSLLTSIAASGFALLPEPALVPLLPRHVHALTAARGPVVLNETTYDVFFSSKGNVAPELFKCIAPLKVGGKLAGLLALGRREDDSLYEDDDLDALSLLSSYVALGVHNHILTQTLTQRVAENLRLLGSLHGFYDSALETFASAIDVKHVDIHGHSLRVARYAAAIGEAMGLDPTEVASLRAAGYLHDIGKVAVDKHLFGKPGALDPDEFRAMADHTVVGHQIVSGIQFPWPRIPDVVRWHHERGDGSGYPDALRMDEIPMSARIIGLADTFDAMTSARPYREPVSVGSTLSELVRLTPQKYDPAAVQALLVQIRRDAVGSNHPPLLDERIAINIAPGDIDQLASNVHHKLSRGRTNVILPPS
jgi:putative nucleotidyltransferase with HDIG domain